MSPTRSVLLLTCLSCLSWAANAQPKAATPAKPPVLDRDLFVVYAIEEFYRDTKVDGPFTPAVGTPAFNRFIQTRRGLVDDLNRHLKENPDRKPLATQMTTYRVLLSKAEEMNKKAMEVDAKYRQKAESLYLKVEQELKMKRNEDYAFDYLPSVVRAARSARWGLAPDAFGRLHWYHENPAQLAYMAGVIKTLQSDARQYRLALKLFGEAQQKESAYWQTARPQMEAEIKEVVATHTSALDDLRKSGAGSLREAAVELAKKKGWSLTEVVIDPEREAAKITAEERPRDPFPYIWRARQVAAPTLDKPDSLDEAHDAAKQSRWAGNMLIPETKPYDPFRALAFEVGGQVALATVTAEVGSSGIPIKALPGKNAAVTARECWELYQNYSGGTKLTDNMRLLHQMVMSYAQQGGSVPIHKAYVLIDNFLKSANWRSTEDAEIWYDFARVCAMEKNQKPAGNLTLSPHERAVWCLRRARMYGFDRVGEAKASADFAALQAGPERIKKEFDLALELPPIRASKK